MPNVVGAVVKGLAVVATWYQGLGPIAKLAVTLGASLAVDAATRSLFGPKTPSGNRDISRDITTRGGVEAKKIVYGQARVSGPLIYTNVSGDENKYLWHVIALAGHEVEDITDVWVDGTEIPSANVNWGSAVSSGKYATYAVFHKKLGTSTQTAQTELAQAFSDITTNHRGRGIAYAVSRFELVEASASSAFESGPPRNLSFVVQGKKVYDPRKDSTSSRYNGSGAHDVADSSTWEYSDNPALCWADYMIDSNLGMGVPTSKIDYEAVADEADYCDGLVPDSDGGTEKRFTCNGVLYTTDKHRVNVGKLLSCMNGRQSFRAGKFVVRAGRMGEGENVITPATFNKAYSVGAGDAETEAAVATSGYTYHVSYQISAYTSGSIQPKIGTVTGTARSATGYYNEIITADGTSFALNSPAGFSGTIANLEVHLVATVTVDESWLAGDIQVRTAPPKSQRFNTFNAIYKDPEREYKDSESLDVTQAAYTNRDGETLRREVNLPMTNSEIEAQRILFKRLFATNQQKSVVMPCNYKALQLAVHDFVRVDFDEFSWDDKIFRVMGWRFSDIGEDGGIELVLQEDSSSAYLDPEDSDYSTRTAAGTVTVGSPGVPPFTNFTATSVLQGILLQADMPTPASAWTHGVLYASPDSSWANAVEIGRGRGTQTEHKLASGETRYYWLKAFRDGEESVRTPDSDTSTVTATAGGANVQQFFYQSSAPSGVGEEDGDFWIDSDDNMIYRRAGGVWGEVQDDDIGQALIDAAAAQAGADAAIRSFYQASPPSGAGEEDGDFWIDTDDGDRLYIRQSSSWVDAQDSEIGQAITDAADAQATADGKITTFLQNTAPTAEGVGDFWLDLDDGNLLYRWSGAAWVDVQDDDAATAAAHASATGNPHSTSMAQISGDLDDIADGSTYFRSTATQNTGGTRAANALNVYNDYVRTLSTQNIIVSGSNPSTGVIFDDDGIRAYNSGSLVLEINTSTLNFEWAGDIDTDGKMLASGNTSSGGANAAIVANGMGNSVIGIVAIKDVLGTADAIEGNAASSVSGVRGVNSGTGSGIYGWSSNSSGHGVEARNTGGGAALKLTTPVIEGDADFEDDVSIGLTLTVTGASTFNSDVTVQGNSSLYVDRSVEVATDGTTGDSSLIVGNKSPTGRYTLIIAEGSAGGNVAGQLHFYGHNDGGQTCLGLVQERGLSNTSSFTLSKAMPIYLNAAKYYIGLSTVP